MSTQEQQAAEQAEAIAAQQEDIREEAGQAAEEQNDSREEAGAELQELRRQSEENHQRLLRLQADYDNFRKRTRQEKEEFAKYASQKLLEQLLPVLDNFDRAVDASKQPGGDYESLVKGLDMINRQLQQVLEQEGVQPMNAVGQPFDPELHQAVMQVESEEFGEGVVVEELQKGYRLKDKVLRPAMVKVNK